MAKNSVISVLEVSLNNAKGETLHLCFAGNIAPCVRCVILFVCYSRNEECVEHILV
jgi:hypothetical protein